MELPIGGILQNNDIMMVGQFDNTPPPPVRQADAAGVLEIRDGVKQFHAVAEGRFQGIGN